jgi:4-hydroxymandelate oxidase
MTGRFTRRRAATAFASWMAATPLLRGQEPAAGAPAGLTPADELVNTFEFGEMAERQLGRAAFERIAGSDRAAFDRMTLRPRMMVNTLDLDLTTDLFGEKMFAPILVGPISDQKQFHPEGELATARGASAAKAVMVVSDRSSSPLEQVVSQSNAVLWYQVYPEPDMNRVRTRIERAVGLGCKCVLITAGTPYQAAEKGPKLLAMGNPGLSWNALDRLRQGIRVPVLLKGVMSPEEARAAVERGFAGIVVSNHGAPAGSGAAAPIETLPAIADAVGGKTPLLVDGGFRRGTDVIKGLALGARAILLGRPAMWGLAAYGADGVRTVLQMLQSELARDTAMCGKVNTEEIGRDLVSIHRR